MVLTESVKGLLGTRAPDFSLPGCDGRTYTLADFSEAKLLVVAFICNHCPYVLAVRDRLNALAEEFRARSVLFVGINSNDAADYPADSFENMPALGLSFPYLRDESQDAALRYHAVCTPDIFVYDSDRRLVYHGRIDDNWKEPEKVTKRELADALTTILFGGTIPRDEQKPAMGCSIKWKK